MRRQAILLISAMVAALLFASGVALAADISCSTNLCQGTPDRDLIYGTDSAEQIDALAGADVVYANGGRDTVYGGRGNDAIEGFGNNDTIYGGSGDDGTQGIGLAPINLEGGEASDKVYGGEGADWIDAAAEDTDGSVDRSYGEEGNDYIYAIDGNEDIIDCGPGANDVVRRDVGIDTIKGGCEVRRAK